MRFLAIAFPLLLLVPAAPAVTPLWHRWRLACREDSYAWPVGGFSNYALRADLFGSGLFGTRRSGGRTHNGIDLAAPVGTPVNAARSGTVRRGRKHNGMGTYLEVRHPDGSVTMYGHLSEILASDGQWIERGRPIGRVGKTGNARRRAIQPHLHFEIRLGGVPCDPLDGYLEGTSVSG
ncbi:MAG: M23 family metallopeptidase [Candidatus Omnitrophica bacterium]|nr:M23 family metallopeptidase [Candidatus Omnitrophota bacterium]